MDDKYFDAREQYLKDYITRDEYFTLLAGLSDSLDERVKALMESMSKDIELNMRYGESYKNDAVVDAYVTEMQRLVAE